MKLKRKGKEYNYDYKSIIIKGDYYRSLNKLSKQHKLPFGKMIGILIEHYESSIR